MAARIDVFRQGLRERGYVEGQSVHIDYRYADGALSKVPDLAGELVRLRMDVIVATSTPVVHALKKLTNTIPIVMTGAADPVGMGFVANLARPGGNITGMSLMSPQLAGKRLELLRELIPKLSRVAFLAHGDDPAHRLFITEAQNAAAPLGIHIEPVVIRGAEEFEHAFSVMARMRVDALIVQPIFASHGPGIAKLAARQQLPASSDAQRFADAGGLMYYGPDRMEMYRSLAGYVDKILKGAKPAGLPVEQPSKFELIINLRTARALGITIPPSILAQADRVIE